MAHKKAVRPEGVTALPYPDRLLTVQRVQCFLETIRMGTFRLGQRFHPVRDLIKTLVTCCLRHPWVHIGVLMGFAGNGRFQVVGCTADGQARSRITRNLKILKMTVCVARFTFRC